MQKSEGGGKGENNTSAYLKDDKKNVGADHLACFVRLAHVKQHALACVVFLTTDDGDHVARFAFERGRYSLATMIPDLDGRTVEYT